MYNVLAVLENCFFLITSIYDKFKFKYAHMLFGCIHSGLQKTCDYCQSYVVVPSV